MTFSGNLIHVYKDWLLSEEALPYYNVLYNKKTNSRKKFSILEKPYFPNQQAEYCYKLFVTGPQNVGKKSTIERLCGCSTETKSENMGIEISHVYWPVQLVEEKAPSIFKLDFWHVGDVVSKKFDYLKDECLQDVDGIVFLFSLTDRNSWLDLSGLFSKYDGDYCRIIIGTKLDLHHKSVVSVDDIRSFSKHWNTNVLMINNNNTTNNDDDTLKPIIHMLNEICDKLYDRDLKLNSAST